MLRRILCQSGLNVMNHFSENARQFADVALRTFPVCTACHPCRAYHTSPVLNLGRKIRKRSGGAFEVKKLETSGESDVSIRPSIRKEEAQYPDENTPSLLFGGTTFKDLPIIHIKASPNNTLMTLTDAAGLAVLGRTCGSEGFRNARKSTNVAAQTTGYGMGKKLMQRGFHHVRIKVQGLGAGRVASIKGMTLAGVNIVSITDNTPISWHPPRPRKQRRL